MIEFTDITLRECQGHYNLVVDEMAKDVGDFDWMLDSLAYVTLSSKVSFTFSLHLWKSGKIDIMETDRPMSIDIPEDDIKELKHWCDINNWKFLCVNDRLLVDPRSFDFWIRMYRCGLVQSDQLRIFDESEMARLSQNGE